MVAGTSLGLDRRYRRLQDRARALVDEVDPVAAAADELGHIHPGLLAALRRSGLCALVVPRSHGGESEEVDPLAVCVVREILMGRSTQLDALFGIQGNGSYAITVAGSDEQRAAWLPGVARGEILAAIALTEDTAGSDLKGMTTEVVETGADRLVLRGKKTWITHAGVADFYTVLAREQDGFTALLVPAGLPGIRVAPGPRLLAPYVLGDVLFDGVELPPTARIGRPGTGFELVLHTLGVFRVGVAGAALGVAQAALEEAVRHGRARRGSAAGADTQDLADAWSELEAARLLAYRAAVRAAADPLGSLHDSSMAKLTASEVAWRVVDRCVQVTGLHGLTRGSRLERLFRRVRAMRIYEGASEVLRLGIARGLDEATTPPEASDRTPAAADAPEPPSARSRP